MNTSWKLQRRQFALVLGAFAAAPLAVARSERPLVEVWKGPTCGCCKDWISYLEVNGFRTKVNDSGNTDIRRRMGVDLFYGACHTGLVEGYAIEGHVPAREIHRLLRERPLAIGLAVPAMPLGSPGMDGPMFGARKQDYDVFLLSKGGSVTVYQSYR